MKPSKWTVSLLAAISWWLHRMFPWCSSLLTPPQLADEADTQEPLWGWDLKDIFRNDLQSLVMRIWAALLKVRTCPPLFSIYSHSHDFTQLKCHLEPNDFCIYIFSSVSWNLDSYIQLPTPCLLLVDISSLACLKLLVPFPPTTHMFHQQSSHLTWWKPLLPSCSA